MAVTVTVQPNKTRPLSVYREINYEATSDDATVKRMKAIIYVDGTAINANAPIVQDPDYGETDVFTFDVHQIVKDHLSYDKQTIDAGDKQSTSNSMLPVFMKFTEVVENVSNQLEDGASLTQTSTDEIYCINAKQTEVEANLSAYELGSSIGWLSDATTKWIGISESEYLDFCLVSTIGTNYQLNIKTYDEDDVLAQTATVSLGSITDERSAIGVGVTNINAHTLTSGSQPLVTNGIAYYVVKIETTVPVDVTEERRFNVDRSSCTNHTRVHFLNRLGGFDSFTFTKQHEESLEADAVSYDKYWSGTVGDRGRTIHKVDAMDTFRCVSRPINKATFTWLKQLYLSSEVYIEVDDQYIPIVVLNRQWEWTSARTREGRVAILEYMKSNYDKDTFA